PEGEWSYERFEQWLIRTGVAAWPRLDSGRLNIDSDAFRLMYHVPGIEGLHALRDSLDFIVKARLPIGRDGRNRPSLFPFGTATGRNAHAKSPYNAHAGMRGFMVFPRDQIGAYLDWPPRRPRARPKKVGRIFGPRRCYFIRKRCPCDLPVQFRRSAGAFARARSSEG